MKSFLRTESLAACIVVASLALPPGAWAQRRATVAVTDGVPNVASVVAPERPFPDDTLDPGRTPSLGDAMAEAYRSPFHAVARAPGLATGGGELDVIGVRSWFSSGLASDSTDGSTPFHDVFVPTLAAAFVVDLGAVFLLYVCVFAVCETEGEGYTVLLLGASAAVLGPAAVARNFGKGTWKNSILGSTIGIGVGLAPIALGMDYSAVVWTFPTIHALLTTVFGRL